MKAAPARPDEAAAIAALRELDVLDSAPDDEIDALANVAAAVCGVPIALVSLIDTDRQWFKANSGLHGVPQTPRELAFCAHAVLGDTVFEVPDAREDDRFADNPLVTGEPSIRFYAGAPVRLDDGHRIGTVCVIDREPRRLTAVQHGVLRNLATAVGKALEGRAAARKVREQMGALAERERALRLVIDAVPSVMAYWDADLRCRFANSAHVAWHGTALDRLVGMHLRDFLGAAIFEANRPMFERVMRGESLELERSVHCADGVQREALLFYAPDIFDGRVVGFLVQLTDVTPLKAAAEALRHDKAEMQRVIELQERTAKSLNDAQRLGRIGSWKADLLTGEVVWSAEMYRVVGRDPRLPPPQHAERFDQFVPESAERLRQASRRCEQVGTPYVLELEFRHHLSGELRWLETRGEAARDVDGRATALVGTIQDITDRKHMAGELARQHELARVALQQLREVTNNLPALISYLDVDQRFRFANQHYGTWLGHAPESLIGTSLVELYGQERYDTFEHHIVRALAGERVSYTRDLPTRLGRRCVDVSVVPDRDASGAVQGLFVMMIDVTARRDAETAMQASEHRLRMVADNIPALVTYLDHEQRYRFVNDFHGSVFHVEPQRLLGRAMRDVAGEKLYGEIAPHVASALRGEQVTFEGVWSNKARRWHYQSTYIPDRDPAGAVRGFYAMTFDITALKETQRRLDTMARVDALTGLPNRREFDERLPEAMARTRRSGDAMSLMFLDVDRFKRINDTLGHGVGDAVLREFADRLRRQVRSTDLVARLAGDEFVMLLEGVHETREVERLARKIVESIRPPMQLGDGSVVQVTTTIGVAVYDGDRRAAADLLAAADRALYQAKHDGRDRYALEGATTLHAMRGNDAAGGPRAEDAMHAVQE